MREQSAGSEGRVFHTLDGLRGVAAVGVVVFHLQQAFAPIATPGGYLAVDLFFLMSGVVISHAYESRFRAGMGPLDFMRARLIRLYPLYLLGLSFGIAVTLASMHGRNVLHWDVASLLRATSLALFFLPNFSGRPVSEMFPLNIPCWSLFFEVLVNILFVVCWPWLSARRLLAVAGLAGAAVAVAAVHGGGLDQGSTAATFAAGLARTVFGFSIGVLIARRVGPAPRQQSNGGFLAIAALVVIAIGAWPTGEWRALWDAACVLLLFPLVVYWGTRVDPGAGLRRLATFLGVTSYAIYVLHSPLSAVLNSVSRAVAGGAGESAGAPWLGCAFLAVVLTGCWLVDHYLDMPIRRRLSRIVPRMRASRAETSKITQAFPRGRDL